MSTSNVVRISIRVKGQDCEVLKKATTKGIEIIEANGAVFYRKRKFPVIATPSDTQHDVEKDDMAVSMQPDQQQPPLPHPPAAAHAEDPVAVQLSVQEGQNVGAMSLGDGQSFEELEGQLHECLPASCPRAVAVQFALEQLLARGAADLDRKAEAHEAGLQQPGAGVYSQAVRRVLQRFSMSIQKQVEEAGRMVVAMGMDQATGPVRGDEVSPLLSPGGKGHRRWGGGSDAVEQYLKAVPPMIRELSQGSQMRPILQQRLSSLEEEERAWEDLRAKCSPAAPSVEAPSPANVDKMVEANDQLGASALPPMLSNGGPEGNSLPPPPPSSLGGVLGETEATVNASIALQVESLAAFLSKVGALVAKGEMACTMLQADYHEEKFKTFPHVNSPAWLITQIVGKHQKRQEGEMEGQGL